MWTHTIGQSRSHTLSNWLYEPIRYGKGDPTARLIEPCGADRYTIKDMPPNHEPQSSLFLDRWLHTRQEVDQGFLGD